MRWRGRFVLFCALAPVAAARAQPTLADLLENKTMAELRRFDESFDGALGMAAIDLTAGHRFALHGDTVFPQASVIKIPILARMYQAARAGRFTLDTRVTITPAEAVGGSGRLQERLKSGAPIALTVRELIDAMIQWSDNTATNKCIALAGMDDVNRMMDSLGLPHTRLRRKMMDAAAVARGEENVSTPDEMSRLVEMIYRGKVVDAAASREMIGFLKEVSGGIREGLPLDIETASKTGELPGARGETGIVFLEGRPFVLSVMSAYIDDRRSPVPDVTRIVYRYFEKLAGANAWGNRLR
ncbi:MAG TPA: serine hydrolase [Bryobacteraceae bacterium]|nr:serine hydrolase [Bryobacteraceae bacterium]